MLRCLPFGHQSIPRPVTGDLSTGGLSYSMSRSNILNLKDLEWPNGVAPDESNSWLNVMMEHVFRDFLKHVKWRKWLHRKMARKLARIKLPNFMDPLKVRAVKVGQVPKLSDAKIVSRDASGQTILTFNLEAGLNDLFTSGNTKSNDNNFEDLSDMMSDENRMDTVFEMSLETKLNPKYFTQHQMLQLSSPTRGSPSDNKSFMDRNINKDDDDDSDQYESDTDDEEDEPTFESISSDEENPDGDDEELVDKSDLLDDWKYDQTDITSDASSMNSSSTGMFEMSAPVTGSVSSGSSPATGSKSLVDRWTDKLKIKTRAFVANSPTVRKYFETVTSSKIGVTVRVTQLKGKLVVCLPAPPSDRLWIKLDNSTKGDRSSLKSDGQSSTSTPVILGLQVVVDMNRKALMIKSNFIRSLLENRLRKQLIQILTTYDDLSLYPLLVLPSCFYSYPSNDSSSAKTIFCDTF